MRRMKQRKSKQDRGQKFHATQCSATDFQLPNYQLTQLLLCFHAKTIAQPPFSGRTNLSLAATVQCCCASGEEFGWPGLSFGHCQMLFREGRCSSAIVRDCS